MEGTKAFWGRMGSRCSGHPPVQLMPTWTSKLGGANYNIISSYCLSLREAWRHGCLEA